MAALLAAATLAVVLAAQSRQRTDFAHDQDYCAHILWKRGHYVCGEEESRAGRPNREASAHRKPSAE